MKLISAALAVVLLAATTALGDVIPRHDPTIVIPPGGFVTGTGNLLFDTETNLEWLDVTVTLGRTLSEVVGNDTPQAVALVPGFRYASPQEVIDFWMHNGITFEADEVQQHLQLPNVAQLIDRWGLTFENPEYSVRVSNAITHPTPIVDGVSAPFTSMELQANHLLGIGIGYGYLPEGIFMLPPRGSALVREAAVPEPSTYALASMAMAFSGAWAAIRRRSKKHHGPSAPSLPNA